MPNHPRLRARSVSLLAFAALAIGVVLIAAATASAHVRPSLESPVSEETATTPLQEDTPETPAEGPTSEASGEAGREQRHKRHEERRERRQRRRAGRELSAASGCTITLDATPSLVTAEDPLNLSGTLSCPAGSSAAGQTVALFQMLARSGGFYEAATTTTEADGTYQFTPSSLAVNSDFYVSADGAQSQTASVKISPHVTIATPLANTQLVVGSGRATRADANSDSANAVIFTGTLTPANAGTRIALQREDGDGAWSRIGGGEVNAEGDYSISHTFYRPGRANIRVVVHGHGLTVTAVSAPVTYQIARRRNRQITIQASADPLAYGAALTITGTVAGALDTPLTLLAQTGNDPFVKLAETTSSGTEYSFSVSPLQSTRYRVSDATASSAILTELVEPAPTSKPPADEQPAGELTPAA